MSYLSLAGTPKSEITSEKINQLFALIEKDARVAIIQKTNDPIRFYIEVDELEAGVYSFGSICNHLNELPSERKSRLESLSQPDIINITKFMSYGKRTSKDIRSLPTYTLECLREAWSNMPPSSDKALLVSTMGYKLYGEESIAERILRDHRSTVSAYNHAILLVGAGCANEINRTSNMIGTIIFEDGSRL